MMAKNGVAPLKRLTLPKLEMIAAVVASRVEKFVVDALKLYNAPIYFWGDNQVALHWLWSTIGNGCKVPALAAEYSLSVFM